MTLCVTNYEGDVRVKHNIVDGILVSKQPLEARVLQTNETRCRKNEGNLHVILIQLVCRPCDTLFGWKNIAHGHNTGSRKIVRCLIVIKPKVNFLTSLAWGTNMIDLSQNSLCNGYTAILVLQ